MRDSLDHGKVRSPGRRLRGDGFHAARVFGRHRGMDGLENHILKTRPYGRHRGLDGLKNHNLTTRSYGRAFRLMTGQVFGLTLEPSILPLR